MIKFGQSSNEEMKNVQKESKVDKKKEKKRIYESCESRTASSCYVSSRPEVPEVASFRPHERSMWDRSSTAGVLNSRRRDKETSIAGVDLASGSVVVVEQRP